MLKAHAAIPPIVPALAAILCLLANACAPTTLKSDRRIAPADGASLFHLTAPAHIQSGARFAHQESPTLLRATVLPGAITLKNETSTLTLTTTPVETDSAQDGTPDFLRLDTPSDRAAFRAWFTYIAEAQLTRNPLPREINDCAALIRYAYRGALSVHNDAWIASAHLPELPSLPPIRKYNYPFTPLGAGLFRIHPGPYLPTDVFTQFADAETLVKFNAHFISKQMDQARPGDILMYRQLMYSQFAGHMPFHTMVYLGASQTERTAGPYVVYHTGPIGTNPGEIRRPLVSELEHHPDPRWRPFSANPNFLGIFRFNILGD
jgi:uncharacterized protein YfaT (DUF1175 family)